MNRICVFLIAIYLGCEISAQVILTEMSATSSEQVYVRDEGGQARLGTGLQWWENDFDDESWPAGTTPVGFGFPDIATDVSADVQNKTPTVYLRQRFSVTADEAASIEVLSLMIDYNDGIIVYLNGEEVHRRYTAWPGAYLYHNQLAHGPVRRSDSPRTVNLGEANGLLHEGENVLAMVVHNDALDSENLKASAVLSLVEKTLLDTGAECRWFPGLISPSGGVFDPAFMIGEPAGDGAALAFTDWIELTNTSPETVDLSGWGLSDNPAAPRRWVFPEGTMIDSDEALIVQADGTGAVGQRLHTNFRLSASGETLQLSDPSGAIVSQIPGGYPQQYLTHSYGLDEQTQSWRYFETATPGAPNSGASFSDRADAPNFEPKGGFYQDAVTLTLTSNTEGALIRFTRNGSIPTLTNGEDYTGPIMLNRVSDKVGQVITARSFKEGQISSKPKIHSYLIGQAPEIVSLPALVFSGEPDEVFYSRHGILSIRGGRYNPTWMSSTSTSYNNAIVRGKAMERPLRVEYYRQDGESFREEAGIRVAASDFTRPRLELRQTRLSPWLSDAKEKASFNLFFRNDYGAREIEFPLFGESYPVARFRQLRVRAGKNDNQNPFILDEIIRRLYGEMGQVSSHGVLNTLYVNGQFKGFYNVCERLREPFMQAHHNSKLEWDVRQVDDYASGDRQAWDTMMALLDADTTVLENWQAAEEYLDPVNMADYFLLYAYNATWDWPHNNWVGARERSPDGRYRLYVWDAEVSYAIFPYGNPLDYNIFTQELIPNEDSLSLLFQGLLKSPEWRLLFADRIHKHLFNGGVLDDRDPENCRLKEMVAELNAQFSPILDYVHNANPVQIYLNNWTDPDSGRRRYLLGPIRNDFAEQGLWPATTPPQLSQHGGTLPLGNVLTIIADEGDMIYYTLDGTDPRVPGGAVAVDALTYTSGFSVPRGNTTVKARAFDPVTSEWSALTEAVFAVDLLPASSTNLMISEIMYHPPSPSLSEIEAGLTDEDSFEFIELVNISTTDGVNLTGLQFTGAVNFTFPVTALNPGERVFIVGERQAFRFRYGDAAAARIVGRFEGNLSNRRETLTLSHQGTIIHSLSYRDQAPWPVCADGQGYSLVLQNPEMAPDHSLPGSWACSVSFGGALGGNDLTLDYSSWVGFYLDDDQRTAAGGPQDDADGDGLANQVEFAFGTDPSQANALPMQVALQREGGVTFPILSFQVPRQHRPVTLQYQSSATLAGEWTHIGQVELLSSSVQLATNTEQRTVRLAEPVDLTGPRFYRIQVLMDE